MATRSTISVLKEDGTVEQVYCHWDGYVDVKVEGCVGMVLNNHYRDRSKAEELISLGWMSSLGEMVHPPEGVEHSFDKPHPDVTVYYHRDRGEKNLPSETFRSYEHFMAKRRTEEFDYLFKDGEWFVWLNVVSESDCPKGWRQGVEWVSLDREIERQIK
jgi:hypothetical protein